ncbi:hypothetical protein IXO390_08600 [Xanthomonas oryzae pv. oryzae]|nr:hypothetical protein IXO141_16890 [Xanthomonas oryzae pv. oryzae]OLI94299.1 hypothetical protein IXO390_08600 [Xanthomonas oryzae pv. oryzae]
MIAAADAMRTRLFLGAVDTRLPTARCGFSHSEWFALRLEPDREVAHDHRHHQPWKTIWPHSGCMRVILADV